MGPRQMLIFHAVAAALASGGAALEEENRQLAHRVELLEEQVRTLVAALHAPAPSASHAPAPSASHAPAPSASHLAEVTERQPAKLRQPPKQRTALSAVLSEKRQMPNGSVLSNLPAAGSYHEEPEKKKLKAASTAYSDDPEHAFFSMGEFSTACLRKVDVVCEMTYSGMQLWNKCHSPQASGCKDLLKDSALLWVAGDPVRTAEEMEKAQKDGQVSEPTSGAGFAALSLVLFAREMLL